MGAFEFSFSAKLKVFKNPLVKGSRNSARSSTSSQARTVNRSAVKHTNCRNNEGQWSKTRGRYTNHHGIWCRLYICVLASKTTGNDPIINYGSPRGWARLVEVGNRRAPEIIDLVDTKISM